MSYTPRRATPSSSKTETKPRTNNEKFNGSADEKKKKRTLTIAIVVILCVVIVVSLLFIFAPADGSVLGIRGAGVLSGGNKKDSDLALRVESETQSGTTNISPYYSNGVLPTAADRHDINIIPNGGANASDLLGKWKLDQGTTYMFDGQGRGIMLTGVDNYTFVYSAENGKLGIDMDTITGNDYEYDYTISGDTLTMTRDGNTFTLTKVE